MLTITCGKCGASQTIATQAIPHGGTLVPCKRCGSTIKVSGAEVAKAAGDVELGVPGPASSQPRPVRNKPDHAGLELGAPGAAPERPARAMPRPDNVELGAPGGGPTRRTSGPSRTSSVELGASGAAPEPRHTIQGLPPASNFELGPSGTASRSRAGARPPAPSDDDVVELDMVELEEADLVSPVREVAPSVDSGIFSVDTRASSDEADLPAPVRASGRGPIGSSHGLDNLPAPVSRSRATPASPPRASRDAGRDGPRDTARDKIDISDLLAPVGPSSKRGPAPDDLLVPRSRPASSGPAEHSAPDLLAPKGKPAEPPARSPARGAAVSASDGDFFDDLLAPAESGNILDVPAPKGYFDNLPGTPSATGGADVPAPKGYFDNLPGPPGVSSHTDVPAPKGYFDNLPGPPSTAGGAEVPAPKGYFDNLPSPTSSPVRSDVLAPKGYFDNLPAARTTPDVAPPGEALSLDLDLGLSAPSPSVEPDDAPGQAFDFGDLELAAPSGKPAEGAAKLDQGLGLPDPPSVRAGRAAPARSVTRPESDGIKLPSVTDYTLPSSGSIQLPSADSIDLALGGESRPDIGLSLDPPASSYELEPLGSVDDDRGGLTMGLPLQPPQREGSELTLDLPTTRPAGDVNAAKQAGASAAKQAGGTSYDEVELPSGPSLPAPSVVKVKPPPGGKSGQDKPKAASTAISRLLNPEPEQHITIDDVARQRTAQPKGTLAPRQQQVQKQRARRLRIAIGLVVILLCGLGAGGYYGYSYMQEREERAAFISSELASARKFLLSDRAGHWNRAASAARNVLEQDGGNHEALGLAAQALFASALDEGDRGQTQSRAASGYMQQITQRAATGPDIDKARALEAIINHKPAVDLLNGVLDLDAGDADAKLYLGWAYAEAGKQDGAEKAFQAALTAAPARKIPALYGLACAQLAMGKREEAQKSFAQVLELRDDHIGALLGTAESTSFSKVGERERAFLAILARDQIDKADPRIVARAWALAGEESLDGGRHNEAAERFAKALAIDRRSIEARVGQARVALAQNRLDEARQTLTDVLGSVPDNLDAALTFSELLVRENKLDEASALADKLIAREKTIASELDVARVYMIKGAILEAVAKAKNTSYDDAIAAYRKASQLAGQKDFRPTVALAELLSRVDRKPEAREVLVPVEDQAAADPSLAFTLGRVYAKADAPALAESWYRKALELQPDNVEAMYQLGRALQGQARTSEAIDAIRGALDSAPGRSDIGVELAGLYEALGNDKEAAVIYGKLGEAADAPIHVLARAGRFFERTGDVERAASMGARIVALQPDYPAGLYLRGVGEFARKEFAAAKESFRRAAMGEPDPHYLEAQGRAAEQLGTQEEALHVFIEASNLDGKYIAPLLGQVRIRLIRRQYDKALEVLDKARALAPSLPSIHRDTGICYQEKGELDKAVPALREAVRLDDKDALAHHALGQAYYDLSDQRKAAEHLTAATRLASQDAPWLTKAYLNLGYVQRSRNNRREAIAAWEAYLARNPQAEAEVAEVRRLLMRLQAR